jgi:hypothetical protein
MAIMSQCDQQTQNNRSEFPASAAIMDEFRKEFGASVKLLYAIENGKSIGKKPTAPKRFATVEQWLNGSKLIDEAHERMEIVVRRGVK